MRRWQFLAMVFLIGSIHPAAAQPARNPFATPEQPARNPFAASEAPNYKYAVTPQAGEWLIYVQAFKGDNAQALAEDMADLLRRDYKLPAYLHDRGRKERKEENERVRKLRKQYDEMLKQLEAQGVEKSDMPFRVKTFRKIEDEFAVLVGKPNRSLKDMDAARDYLDDIRKLKPPPDKYSMKAFEGTEELTKDPRERMIKPTGSTYVNPFRTAMVVHNPSIPVQKQQNDPEKADKFLKELNEGESLSVLKCSKPWTLVVKMYQGQAMLQPTTSPSIMSKLGFGKKDGELLNASSMQAHATAEFLRSMKLDAYVMHSRQYSIVTVGGYEGRDDPNMIANQKVLAGMQLRDSKTGLAMETLNAQPLPMKIPR